MARSQLIAPVSPGPGDQLVVIGLIVGHPPHDDRHLLTALRQDGVDQVPAVFLGQAGLVAGVARPDPHTRRVEQKLGYLLDVAGRDPRQGGLPFQQIGGPRRPRRLLNSGEGRGRLSPGGRGGRGVVQEGGQIVRLALRHGDLLTQQPEGRVRVRARRGDPIAGE